MKIKLEIEGASPEQMERYTRVLFALVRVGGLDGVKRGRTVIHWNAEGNFAGIQLDYMPWIEKDGERRVDERRKDWRLELFLLYYVHKLNRSTCTNKRANILTGVCPFFFSLMHPMITKLLGKRGIKDTLELSPEERKTFDDWQRILSKEELGVDDIKNFLRNQISVIEKKWSDLDKDQSKKAELIPYFMCYKTLLGAISSPMVAREALEQQLNQMLNQ